MQRCKVSLTCTVRHTQIRCTPCYRYLVAKSSTTSGQLVICSQAYPGQMYPPATGIWWPRAVLCQVSLTFAIRHTQVRCTPSPTRGIWWPRAVLHQVGLTVRVRCKVGLTCTVRHSQVRCTPTAGIWLPRVVLHQVSLTCQLDICSQMYPAYMSDEKSSSL